MQYLTSDFIFPGIGEAYHKGILAVHDDGTILALYPEGTPTESEPKYYPGLLCPGFVNTHCHLELSWAWGKIQQHKGLDHFIRSLEALKSTILPEQQLQAIENEGDKMLSSGIVAVADISNTSLTDVYKQKAQAFFHTFVELYGSDPDNAEMIFIKGKELLSGFTHAEAGCSASLTPHSTYSVSADLFQLIAENQLDSPVSIHHMETADELDFFKTATGTIAERRNLFNPHLQPLAASGKRPMEAIAPYFDKNKRILLVHNTFSELTDFEFVVSQFNNAFWCMCPGANMYIENRLPDLDIFRKSSHRITLGTDSLASNTGLDMLNEIRLIQENFPHIPLHEIFGWATCNGATFLQLDHQLGSFKVGARPGVVHVTEIDTAKIALTSKSKSHLIISPFK